MFSIAPVSAAQLPQQSGEHGPAQGRAVSPVRAGKAPPAGPGLPAPLGAVGDPRGAPPRRRTPPPGRARSLQPPEPGRGPAASPWSRGGPPALTCGTAPAGTGTLL